MIITKEELELFSGVYVETNSDSTQLDQADIQEMVIKSAGDIINKYLKFDCEAEDTENPFYDETEEEVVIPVLVKDVCLEIASLLQMEQSNNIGVNNKNFDISGSRSFLNVTNFEPYLKKISAYRKVII